MVIATVAVTAGEAYAHNTKGELRVLAVGDQLTEGETVVTPDGVSVELELADGRRERVEELGCRRIGRELIRAVQKPPAASPGARFTTLVKGAAVQTADGQDLFFNERPLYWGLDADAASASAVAHGGCDGRGVDETAFSLRLGEGDLCSASVASGDFTVEVHHIPFVSEPPMPGQPAHFFGIADSGASALGADPIAAGAGFSAAVHGKAAVNRWHQEDHRAIFEFRRGPDAAMDSDPSAGRRVNGFSFVNSGGESLSLVLMAYRSDEREPVFEAGSPQLPLELAAGSQYCIHSSRHFDRLVITRLSDGGGTSEITISPEGYSEFEPADVAMSVAIVAPAGSDRLVPGRLLFDISRDGGCEPAVHFSADAGAQSPRLRKFDTIWDRLV